MRFQMTDLSEYDRIQLLIAIEAQQREEVLDALGPHFELSFVSTINQLEVVLGSGNSKTYHLVICSTDFDESRMFQMLDLLRHGSHLKSLPFVVLDAHPLSLNAGTTKAAIELMGARYLRLPEGKDPSFEGNLREAVLASLMRSNREDAQIEIARKS